MTLPRPPWEFRDQHDERKFKAWLNQQLDAFDEPTADDIWREGQMTIDDAFQTAMPREYGRQRLRGWLLRVFRQLRRGTMRPAARNRALQALRRLRVANDPELANLALQALTHRRERGREPGDPRSRDLSAVQRVVRQDALVELDRIREIMMRHWGRYKDSDPIALEIMAKRSGLSTKALVSARKNRPRHSGS